MLGFVEGQEARNLLAVPRPKRRTQVLASLARYFGPQAQHVTAYYDKSWAADPWSRGCYVGYFPPGVLTGYGEAVRAPVGHLHWAGTETATLWNGYMDGAIQSGYRAADEVIATL
jgi:monoamine oxidase